MEQTLSDLLDVLDRLGLQAGLEFLNKRVPHRWTAVYQLDRSLMRNRAIVDKQREPDLGVLATVPLQDSFCQFAIRDGKFVSSNTGGDLDSRLIGHPYKGVLNSYVGLPLMLRPDQMYGTFCHFDAQPQAIDDAEFELLQRVSRVLPKYLGRLKD